MKKTQSTDRDPEIAAIGAVHKALEGLGPEALARVLKYVADKLKVNIPLPQEQHSLHQGRHEDAQEAIPTQVAVEASGDSEDELEGISPIAKKWMSRNGLQAKALATIFSLGVDEIDLVAKKVPGEGKKDRMRNVLLLKGIAAYIGTGAARFTHEQLKEACLHYQAYDAANFATYMKRFSGDASGDKRTGYTLTPRGLNSATGLVKQILQIDGAH